MKCGKMRIILMLAVAIYVTGQAMSTDETINNAIANRDFDNAQQMINDLKTKNSKLSGNQRAIQNRKVKSLQAALDRAKKAPAKTRQPVKAQPARIQPQPQPQVTFPVREPEMERPFETPMEQEPVAEPARTESFALFDAIENNIAQARDFYNQKSHQQFMQALNRAHQGVIQLDQQTRGARLTADFMHRRESIVKEINALIEQEERRMRDARSVVEQPREGEKPAKPGLIKIASPDQVEEIQALDEKTQEFEQLLQDIASKDVTAAGFKGMLENAKEWYEDLDKQIHELKSELIKAKVQRDDFDLIVARMPGYKKILEQLQKQIEEIETKAVLGEIGNIRSVMEEVENLEQNLLKVNSEIAVNGITEQNYSDVKNKAMVILADSEMLNNQVDSLLKKYPTDTQLRSIISRIKSVENNIESMKSKIETFESASRALVPVGKPMSHPSVPESEEFGEFERALREDNPQEVVSAPSRVFQGEKVMPQPSDVGVQPKSEEEQLAELEKSFNG